MDWIHNCNLVECRGSDAAPIARAFITRDSNVYERRAVALRDGEYKKQLYDRVYTQWLARVKAHDAELRVGTVRVRLTLIDTGKIRDLRLLSTGASGRLKRLTLDAINHTDIAPPPLLKGQRDIDVDLTFRLLEH